MKRNTRRYGVELRHYDSYTGGGCRVYVYEELQRGCTAGGCGYDRGGKAMSNWLMTIPSFIEAIKHLTTNYGSGDNHNHGYYGLRFINQVTHKYQNRYSKNCRAYVDGACGLESVKRIVKAIGGDIEWITGNKSSDIYNVYLPE